MQKMDPVVKKNWLKALRSGEYKQGNIFLRRKDNSYCCLGVLLEANNLVTWKEGDGKCYFPITESNAEGDPLLSVLESKVKHKIKLSREAEGKLMQLNNDEGYSFKEIADWIEENL